jgi:hypothetical protein
MEMTALLARIRAEFTEMPGLVLTFHQACRLWAMDASTCEAVLHTLVSEQFLTRTKNGAFVAVSNRTLHPPTVKATLGAASIRTPLRRPA